MATFVETSVEELSIAELAAQRLESSRGFIFKLVETLSDEQLLVRAGGAGNHALWIMGHLAVSDELLMLPFTGEESGLPENAKERFAAGSQPSERREDYPSREELLGYLDKTRKRTIAWGLSLRGDALWNAAPEEVAVIAPNAASALHTLAEHDYLHAGQLATIRASLGMRPLFM